MKNKKIKIILFISTIIIILICFIDKRIEINVSKESGFYESSFYLEIKSSYNCDIYYTLDGSIPNENSIKYEKPILIVDATNQPNTNSMRTDLSICKKGFDAIEAFNFNVNQQYATPETLIDKATILNVVAISKTGEKSDIHTYTYFVGFNNKKEYDNINFLSIVVNPDYLFGDDGIYVNGSSVNSVIERIEKGVKNSEEVNLLDANYYGKGINYERAAHLTFFDTEKKILLDGNYGIRIQGASSRPLLPKSLNIYAREEYGTNMIPGKVLDLDYKLKKINLFSGSHSFPTKINNVLINEFIKCTNLSRRVYKPYVMFLNGEFWGVYWLREVFDENYFDDVYDVDKQNLVLVKNGSQLEIGAEEDEALYKNLIDFVAKSDISKSENYDKLCEMIDIDNFIEYCAIELFFGNIDWPDNNVLMWRTRENKGKAYQDGKWRFIIYDTDLALSNCFKEVNIYNINIFESLKKNDFFLKIYNNSDFKNLLNKKIMYLQQVNKTELYNYIDNYEKNMKAILEKEILRFYNDPNIYNIADSIKSIKNNIRYRDEQTFCDEWSAIYDGLLEPSEMLANNKCIKEYNSILLKDGGIIYGPYARINPGLYRISFVGENLDLINCDIYSSLAETDDMIYAFENISHNRIVINLKIEKTINDIEFRLFCNTNKNRIVLNNISIEEIG